MSDDAHATLPPAPAGDGPSLIEDPGPPVEQPYEGPGDLEAEETTETPRSPRSGDEVSDEEVLVPKMDPVERTLRDVRGREATYVQRPLMYFQKLELYGILGEAVQVVMEGEGGLGLDELMGLSDPRNMLERFMSDMPGANDAPDAEENETSLDEAGKVLAAFAKVVALAPNLIRRAYLVVLDIPTAHRKWAMDWGLPTVDDEMGLDIMHTFLDQNWGAMEDFFVREIPKLAKRAAQARRRHKSGSAR